MILSVPVVQDVSFAEFESKGVDGKPPIHQMVYLKRDGQIVWDFNTTFSK